MTTGMLVVGLNARSGMVPRAGMTHATDHLIGMATATIAGLVHRARREMDRAGVEAVAALGRAETARIDVLMVETTGRGVPLIAGTSDVPMGEMMVAAINDSVATKGHQGLVLRGVKTRVIEAALDVTVGNHRAVGARSEIFRVRQILGIEMTRDEVIPESETRKRYLGVTGTVATVVMARGARTESHLEVHLLVRGLIPRRASVVRAVPIIAKGHFVTTPPGVGVARELAEPAMVADAT